MPDSFVTTPDGLLLVANGIDPVLVWDGLQGAPTVAGMTAPVAAPTFAGSGSGSITGTYYAFLRFVDFYGNFSPLSPVSTAVTVSAVGTITYSSVEAPIQEKVVRRQILRNTAGQADVFYVDVDTTDLTSTSFASTKTDSLLAASDYQSLFDENDRDLSTVNNPPPSDKAILAVHLDRVFLAGEEEYTVGCISLTAGSLTVTGINTLWPESLGGRFLRVRGADRAYEIASVDSVNQTLTLLEPWAGASDPYAEYAIRPSLADRKNVYFSEAGFPQSWWPGSAVPVQEDGDRITGMMPKGSFLYILQERSVYRLTFQDSPATDGYIFLTVGRGCVNNRCWVVVDDAAYLLDRSGCWVFGGGQEAESISDPIQTLFRSGKSDAGMRINWAAERWFHCGYDPAARIIRWFVTMSGGGLPRHAICFDLAKRSWWIEKYPTAIGCSTTGELEQDRRLFVGAGDGGVHFLEPDRLDRVDHNRGTVRGTAVGAGLYSLDTGTTFPTGTSGSYLSIVAGKGKHQHRRIVGSSGTVLYVDRPWTRKPDDTSVWQIAGIRWRYRTGWFRWATAQTESQRRLEIVFDPLPREAILDARVYTDRRKVPVRWDYSYTSDEADGFASREGEFDLEADLGKETGFVQRRMAGHKDLFIDGSRYMALSLSGVSNADKVQLISMRIDGAEQ